jgi:hypothetical protein
MLLVPAVVLAITCGHSRPRTAEPEPDDQRDGATSLAIDDATHRATAAGTLAPRDGDTVDWLEVLLPSGPRQLELEITVDGSHLPAALELYDGHGAIISHLDRRPGNARSTASARTVAGGGRVYIRIADDTDASTIAYAFSIVDHGQAEPDPPPGPPPCDPANWDAKNPSCERVCNLAEPDLGREACCIVLQPCVRRPRGRSWGDCVSPTPSFAGDTIIAPFGSEHAQLQRLEAYLDIDGTEPAPPALSEADRIYRERRISRNSDHEPRLSLVEIRARESVWQLTYPKDHDLAWLQAHATAVVAKAPFACSHLGSGRP